MLQCTPGNHAEQVVHLDATESFATSVADATFVLLSSAQKHDETKQLVESPAEAVAVCSDLKVQGNTFHLCFISRLYYCCIFRVLLGVSLLIHFLGGVLVNRHC
jgi:hypothetical protein